MKHVLIWYKKLRDELEYLKFLLPIHQNGSMSSLFLYKMHYLGKYVRLRFPVVLFQT